MIRKHRFLMFLMVLVPSVLLLAGEASAFLQRVGPLNTAPEVGNFPAWYQDNTGITLEFCDPINDAELDGGWCLVTRDDPGPPPAPGVLSVPETFPTNFVDEHFYFAAGADATTGPLSKAILTLAVEAAFAADVVPGGQITFARIRIDLSPLTVPGTYRIIHPYGEELVVDVDPLVDDRIFITDDVGIACPPGHFDCALASRLGPFLLPSSTPGGPELHAEAGPVVGKLYIALPTRLGPVTGSPLPNFIDSDGASRNHNIFRVEGPPDAFGTGIDFIETINFSLVGRLLQSTIPSLVTVDRANYSRNSAGGGEKVEVFVTGFPTAPTRDPTDPIPPPVPPDLSFFDAPCAGGVDPPAPATQTPMFNAGSNFWGETQPLDIPLEVCVKDNVTLTYYPKIVTDEVTITEAIFNPTDNTLSVKARSSDKAVPPILTLGGFGDLTSGAILVSPLAAPPAHVLVISTAGGLNESQVTTSPAPPTSVTLSAVPADNTWTGNSITFTAVNDGTGPFEYEFWTRELPSGTFDVPIRTYLQSNSWTWDTTGLPIGDYEVMVNVRTVGSAELFEATATIPYTLTVIPAATGVTFTPAPSPASPQTAGTAVTFTAAGEGGSGTYEYKFYRRNPAGAWTLEQDYPPGGSGSATWVWDTTGAALGTHTIQVWVRSAGSTATWEAVRSTSYVIGDPAPPAATGVTFTPPPNPASPQPAGTAVTVTAAGEGGSGTYEYKFYRRNPAGAWTLEQDYPPGGSGSAIWVWDTSGAALGTHTIQVWVRSAGSVAAWEAVRSTSYEIIP